MFRDAMKEIKKKIFERKQAKKALSDFGNGRIFCEDFWKIYTENEELQKMLVNDRFRRRKYSVYTEENGFPEWKSVPYIDRRDRLHPDNLLSAFDINSLEDRCFLFFIVARYLRNRRKPVNYDNNRDRNYEDYLLSMLPSWAGTNDYTFLENILNSAPKGDKKSRINWCKRRCKELFLFDKYKPHWPANSEQDWPIVDGVPYRFSHEEIPDEDRCEIYFYFYNPQNKEDVICVEKV